MPQPSSNSSTNFSINYFLPFVRGGHYLGNLSVATQNWSHTIAAFGGFDRAEFSLLDTPDVITDWIEDGLGRYLKAYDETGVVMWEGFVNRISVQVSGFEVSLGPLTDIVNRAKLVYSTFDTTAQSDLATGVRKETTVSNNTRSQLRYGIFYKALSAAGVTLANAVQLRDMYLTQHAWPETSSSFSPSSSGVELRVECLGLIHLFSYPYNRVSGVGTVNVSTKISQILAADPNVLITDTSGVQTNSVQVSSKEDENRSALELLKTLVATGDSSFNRWTLGIYEDKRLEYAPVSSQPEYFINLGDPNFTIRDRTEAVIKPWQVRPGKWVMFNDFLPAFTPEEGDLNLDPRALFIEETTFRLPQGVEFNGGKTTKLNQRLAQLGLAGIAA